MKWCLSLEINEDNIDYLKIFLQDDIQLGDILSCTTIGRYDYADKSVGINRDQCYVEGIYFKNKDITELFDLCEINNNILDDMYDESFEIYLEKADWTLDRDKAE